MAVEFAVEGSALAIIQAMQYGPVGEYCILGARGDRKTSSFLLGTLFHAHEHARSGHPLPVQWMSVRDTMQNHRLTTVRTLQAPWWHGLWKVYKDEKVAVARVQGKEFVKFDLFGVEDEGAMDRLRMEVVGVHFEEVAPAAAFNLSAGVSEDAWMLALTSRRLPSHVHPGVITTNYPDEDHWSWMRFVVNQHPGTRYIRIPPGEYASAEQRKEWMRVLAGRPDLLKRLLEGQPGSVQIGSAVTQEYRPERHYQAAAVVPAPGTLYFGWDYWFHPAVTIGALTPMGQFRFHFTKRLDGADVGSLIDDHVIPWLGGHGLMQRPRVHSGDPTGEGGDQSDKAMSAVRLVLKKLPGEYRRVSNAIEQRERAIKDQLRASISTGDPRILLCGPDTWELHKALNGGWHKRRSGKVEKEGDRGKHSHVGDAAAYILLAIYGRADEAAQMERWVNQSAYTAAWAGQPEGMRSPSPAARALARGTGGFNAEVWKRQYRETDVRGGES